MTLFDNDDQDPGPEEVPGVPSFCPVCTSQLGADRRCPSCQPPRGLPDRTIPPPAGAHVTYRVRHGDGPAVERGPGHQIPDSRYWDLVDVELDPPEPEFAPVLERAPERRRSPGVTVAGLVALTALMVLAATSMAGAVATVAVGVLGAVWSIVQRWRQ